MGLLEDFDSLEENSEYGLNEYYLDNLEDEDMPAFYQAWYCLLEENFSRISVTNKVIYIDTLKRFFPRVKKSRLSALTYITLLNESSSYDAYMSFGVGEDTFINYVNRALDECSALCLLFEGRSNISKKILETIYSTMAALNDTKMIYLLSIKSFIQDYNVYVHGFYDKEKLKWNLVHSKYDEIRKRLESILDIKMKKGEL